MAYEVTKRIRGRAYRYNVESYRDPRTKKTRQKWTYLGRVESDSLAVPHDRPADDPKRRIIEAVFGLLDKRDVADVTVEALIRDAGVSRTTFYRTFADKKSAILAAFDALADEILATPPSLDGVVASPEEERAKLEGWVVGILIACRRYTGIRRAITTSPETRDAYAARREALRKVTQRTLAAYFETLRAAGVVDAADIETLAAGVSNVLQAIAKLLLDEIEGSDEIIRSTATLIDRAVFGPHPARAKVKKR